MTAARRALIVGSGIAGLTAALELGDCTVVTRTGLGEGSSRWAQGGLAAAMGPDDSPAHHADDTRRVSGGLTIDTVVDLVTRDAPDRVRWLQAHGARFDVDPDGALVLGREAGHRARRIVHAGGDATGAVVMRALVAAVRARSDIEVLDRLQAIDLVRAGDTVVGITARAAGGATFTLLGPAVVLATGGIGRTYLATTNPPEATGDGLAMAWRAGASIRDPEFVQFHPTALLADVDPLPLITEALRGEGATLVNAAGHRYLVDVHPDAELAPRDVVARANWYELQSGPIHLDARGIGARLPEAFPTVVAACRAAGIDPRRSPIPVTPAQHYHVGGIRTDEHGRTDLTGLYACGEAASVGLHGANRLASNSLVEGLVMGARVAAAIADAPSTLPRHTRLEIAAGRPHAAASDDHAAVTELRTLMWQHGGLVRDADGLTDALDGVARLRSRLEASVTGRNLAVVAEVVLRAALARRGSLGGHHRTDDPGEAGHDAGRDAGVDGAGDSDDQHTVMQDHEARRDLLDRTSQTPRREVAS